MQPSLLHHAKGYLAMFFGKVLVADERWITDHSIKALALFEN